MTKCQLSETIKPSTNPESTAANFTGKPNYGNLKWVNKIYEKYDK